MKKEKPCRCLKPAELNLSSLVVVKHYSSPPKLSLDTGRVPTLVSFTVESSAPGKHQHELQLEASLLRGPGAQTWFLLATRMFLSF
jgi:hypothetical protein